MGSAITHGLENDLVALRAGIVLYSVTSQTCRVAIISLVASLSFLHSNPSSDAVG
jgi:hypothetical protein